MMDLDFSNSSKEEVQEFYKQISENVKKYRTEEGITQLDLALEIGIKSVAFYSNCENNRYDKHFNLEHLYKLSKVFDIEVQDLLPKKRT